MTKTLTEKQIRKIIENGTEQAAKVCKQKFYDKPKSLTEQWREGTLSMGYYYVSTPPSYGGEAIRYLDDDCSFGLGEDIIQEVLAPVPDYDSLYNPNDGRIPFGLFTVLKLIKRDIERTQEYRNLTDLECGIKSQVVSLLKRRGWDLGKDELVSNSDELVTKCHQLEKRLEVSEKEHYRTLEQLRIATKALREAHKFPSTTTLKKWCEERLKEMEGVK